ncbi:MAG: hypothetical protein Q8Q38_02795 [bacterium]|nr:hypothetical protein [bacterium]
MASVTRRFEEFFGLAAMVLLEGRPLEVNQASGILSVPAERQARRLDLGILIPQDARIFGVVKDVGNERGDYASLKSTGSFGSYRGFSLPGGIEVIVRGNRIWTSWHQQNPNRADCWYLGQDGTLKLFQVGVITPDNGETFRLIGDFRWEGSLFRTEDGVVAYQDPGYQGFETWEMIMRHPGFSGLVGRTRLTPWSASCAPAAPELDEIPEGNFARLDWWSPFAGQNGQGIARLTDRSSAWVHGENIAVVPGPDGVKRIPRNSLLSFSESRKNWGTKSGPPMLLGLRVVE